MTTGIHCKNAGIDPVVPKIREKMRMINSLKTMSRPLTASEDLILRCMCMGQSNLCISENTHFSVKTIENTISRSAKVFGVSSSPDVNLRVLLSVAYEANCDKSKFDSTEKAITHLASL